MEWRRKQAVESKTVEAKAKVADWNQSTPHGNERNRPASHPWKTDGPKLQNIGKNANSSEPKITDRPPESPSSSSSSAVMASKPKPRRRSRRGDRFDSPKPAAQHLRHTGESSLSLVKECVFETKSSRAIRLKEVQFGEKIIQATVTADSQTAEQWLRRQTGKLFGMDLEWKPNTFKGEDNKAALLQLCGDRDCLILQLFYLDAVPWSLLRVLNDSQIILAGVEIVRDADKLTADYGFGCQGLVDLRTLAADRLGRPDLKHSGLKTLAGEVLGLSLLKSKRITRSNWENQELKSSQVDYACIDAYVSFAVAQRLLEHQN